MTTGNKKVIACYVRVSTLDQKKGLETQKRAIQEWLDGQQMQAVWYCDTKTGKTMQRPAWEKLQKDIFLNKVACVAVYKLDRLSRNSVSGATVVAELLEKDIRVVSVTQQFDFSGITGKFVMKILFAVAEMEVDHIRERTVDGLRNAVAKGKTLGRPKKESLHARVNALRDDGKSLGDISKVVGVSRQRVHAILKTA